MKRRTFLQNAGAAALLPVAGCSRMRDTKTTYKPKDRIPLKKLGKTDIEVSLLGFGSHLANSLRKKPKIRDKMIKLGYEAGINTYDVYDHGGYEQFKPMSKSIRDFRKDMLISLVAVKPKEEMQAEIDNALKTFKTGHIDLYRNQRVDDDRMNILEKNRQAGKIRAVGVVSHDANAMMRYIDDYESILDYVMIIYNFHHHMGRPRGGEKWPLNEYSALIPRCERLELGILGIKPMGSDDMIALANKEGYLGDPRGSIAQAMLRYVYNTPEIDCVMPAMNSLDELITNLETTFAPKLSSDENIRLKRLSNEASALRGAYLRPHYRWLENWAGHTA